MSKPFDASLKEMVESYPSDWPPLVGFPKPKRVELIDADVSTVTAAADKVLRIHDPYPWLLHLEPQASADVDLADRLHLYNVVLYRRHRLRVRSVALLLRRAAEVPGLTGTLHHGFPQEMPYLEFRYQVIRLWQMPVATILAGGLGILPLAPLADEAETALPGIIAQMKERFDHETTPERANVLWTATYVLLGLRYPQEQADHLLRGIYAMQESVTYQAILHEGEQKGLLKGLTEGLAKGLTEGRAKGLAEGHAEGHAEGLAEGHAEGLTEGRTKEARALLLRLGRKHLGAPDAATVAALEQITDIERLEQMAERSFEVTSWQELLVIR